ncbi:MAG: hypothetical protein A2X78_00835 [Gammaproteobacteria bacterium GWE2_37_16]|nr:MAG: hypothetical protein A2X78_00835 [Gammaproteobacteria bacterium GWE2_37_16]
MLLPQKIDLIESKDAIIKIFSRAIDNADVENIRKMLNEERYKTFGLASAKNAEERPMIVQAIRAWCEAFIAPDDAIKNIHAARSYPDIIKLLAQYGAQLDVTSKNGFTALSLAERYNNSIAIALLKNLSTPTIPASFSAAPPPSAPMSPSLFSLETRREPILPTASSLQKAPPTDSSYNDLEKGPKKVRDFAMAIRNHDLKTVEHMLEDPLTHLANIKILDQSMLEWAIIYYAKNTNEGEIIENIRCRIIELIALSWDTNAPEPLPQLEKLINILKKCNKLNVENTDKLISALKHHLENLHAKKGRSVNIYSSFSCDALDSEQTPPTTIFFPTPYAIPSSSIPSCDSFIPNTATRQPEKVLVVEPEDASWPPKPNTINFHPSMIHEYCSKLPQTPMNLPETHEYSSCLPMPMGDSMIGSNELKIDSESFIGSGAFGCVYKARYQPINTYQRVAPLDVAVKVLNATTSSVQQDSLRREADIMRKLAHKNIISFFGLCLEENKYTIVMEYMGRGSLDKNFQSDTNLGHWAVRYQVASDISEGLAYLHKQNPPILHHDLKSANILLGIGYEAKISDFGLSKARYDHNCLTATRSDGICSRRWAAPETLDGKPYTTSSDIYSLGVIFWQLATQEQLPWKDITDSQQIESFVKGGRRPEIPESTPNAFATLISSCWAQLPKDRLTADQVVKELREHQNEIVQMPYNKKTTNS